MSLDPGLLWMPATLLGSAGQVARNAMQRRLTDIIGTVGATQVRFLYGFPFALLFLAAALLFTGERLPAPGPGFPGLLALGAATQVGATALMLAAMRLRSFSVVTALLKTEPIQLALFGAVVLGDRLPPLGLAAVAVATAGVVLVSWTSRAADAVGGGDAAKPILLGLAAAGLFALSSVGLRGAILSLDGGSFLVRASTALAWSLGAQTAMLLVWLGLFDRPALVGSFREWRSSVFAGFVGAAASQFWFIGFSLTAAANVRTLALLEVVWAQIVAARTFNQQPSRRELAGMALIVVGVVMLLVSVRPA